MEPEIAHDWALEELEIGDFFERNRGFGLVEDTFFDIEGSFGECATEVGKVLVNEESRHDCVDDGDGNGDNQEDKDDDRLPSPVGFDLWIELGFS